MASKSDTLISHARRRFDERYGIILTQALHQELVHNIQTGTEATFLLPQSNRVSLWSVNINEKYIPRGETYRAIPVAYDKVRKLLVTALPIICMDINNIGLYTHEWLHL